MSIMWQILLWSWCLHHLLRWRPADQRRLCRLCGRPLAHALPDHLCRYCWLAPPPLATFWAGFVYNDFSRTLIILFKYCDALHLTPVLRRFVTRHYTAINDPSGLVIPMSLHRRSFLLGRYNQSAELARWLAPPETFAPNILQRRRHNKSQSGLSRLQRKKNVAGIFSVPHKYRDTLSCRPVIIVDDVKASGATLSAATRCLLAAGGGPVMGLVVAHFLQPLR